jgi:hypothetical protein
VIFQSFYRGSECPQVSLEFPVTGTRLLRDSLLYDFSDGPDFLLDFGEQRGNARFVYYVDFLPLVSRIYIINGKDIKKISEILKPADNICGF